jgi:hypothetical protein
MTKMATRLSLMLLVAVTTSSRAHAQYEYGNYFPDSAHVAAAARECLYNETHCACTAAKSKNAGVCLRHVSGPEKNAICNGDSCRSDCFKCDCLGTDVCEMKSCGSWKATDLSRRRLRVGASNVPCKFEMTDPCISKIGKLSAPVEEAVVKVYKMVQLGSKKNGILFNMTYQTDRQNGMVKKFQNGGGASLHDSWPDKASLKLRQLNIRLYQSEDATEKFVCTIIGSWGGDNDGLGNYKVHSTITGRNGQPLRFMQCDDWSGKSGTGECAAPFSGTTLTANHNGMVTHTDGWCAGPLTGNGDSIGIKFDGVENIEGVNFLGGDGEASEFTFIDSNVGLIGEVDNNGLVHGGSVPQIIIKPFGILV